MVRENEGDVGTAYLAEEFCLCCMVHSGHAVREIPRFIFSGLFPPGWYVATFLYFFIVQQDNFTHTHADAHGCLRNITV